MVKPNKLLRGGWRSVLVWARALLLLSLISQSALGCTDVHSMLFGDDATQVQDQVALVHDEGAVDHKCDLSCTHCHSGCVHAALLVQATHAFGHSIASAPNNLVIPRLPDSSPRTLLRPPRTPV